MKQQAEISIHISPFFKFYLLGPLIKFYVREQKMARNSDVEGK